MVYLLMIQLMNLLKEVIIENNKIPLVKISARGIFYIYFLGALLLARGEDSAALFRFSFER